MRDAVVVLLMITGSLFMLLSAIGILRMPDLYTRMHAATKVGTVGVSGVVLALAVHMNDLQVTAPALTIVVFFLVTAPIAAHMIGRAGYHFGVPLWKGTVVDELAARRQKHPYEHPYEHPSQPPAERAP